MLTEHWQTMADNAKHGHGEPRRAAALTRLAALRFQGADVEKFLQGYLTCDLGALADTRPHLCALTNLKGRVVADGWCRLSAECQVDWIIDASLTEIVRTFMQRYLAFSRTELSLLAHDHLIIGQVDGNAAPVARVVENAAEVDQILSTHRPISAADWHMACIDAAIPLVCKATTEAFLPQMLGLVAAGAVNFDKGCYLGQEVIARAQHRGAVKRALVRLAGDTAALQPGSPLTDADARELGTVINSVSGYCLAVVRTPAADEYRAGDARLIPDQS